jgi:hypothetical protein
MRKITLILSCICILFYSCENKPKVVEKSREVLKAKIMEMEDSILLIKDNTEDKNSNMLGIKNIELINRLTAYYTAFPKDEYAADCLFKLHMKLTELNAHDKALEYGDTLLLNFPNYKNKDYILESLGSTYDLIIQPRDTSKIRYYYSLLLKEKNLTKEKRDGIVNRLKYINLDFFAYIQLNNKEVSR